MLKYFLPILLILMLNTLPLQIFKKKFGDVLPITFISVPIILFITQFIFKTFNVGVILICVAAVAGTVLLFIRRKNLTDYFSGGFFVFLTVAFIILILDFRRSFSDFDEFWHWGPMVKEMLRLDRFYCVDASRMVIHKDYPPFPALYELFAAKVGLGYSEPGIYTALHVMLFSVLACPVSEKIGFAKKKILKTLLFGLSLCILLLGAGAVFDVSGAMFTILADFPVSVFFALAIYLVLSKTAYEDAAGFVSFALSCVMITMSKQVGLPIMLVAVFMYFLVGIAEKKKISITIGLSAASVVLPAALYLAWSKYVVFIGINDLRATSDGAGQFSLSNIDFGEYINIVLKRSDIGIRYTTFWYYMNSLFTKPVTASWIALSYVAVFAGVIAVVIVLAIRFKNDFKPRTALCAGVAFTVGTIGYAFMLSVSYVFCFVDGEMIALAGFGRYIDSFLAGEALGLVLVFVLLFSKKVDLNEKPFYIPIFALISLVILGTYAIDIAPAVAKENRTDQKYDAEYIASVTEPDSSIYLVYDCGRFGAWYGWYQAYTAYYLNDRDFPLDFDAYYSAAYDEDIISRMKDRSQQTSGSDYLYIIDTNDKLNSALAPYTGTEALLEKAVYKYYVDDNDNLQVTLVQ